MCCFSASAGYVCMVSGSRSRSFAANRLPCHAFGWLCSHTLHPIIWISILFFFVSHEKFTRAWISAASAEKTIRMNWGMCGHYDYCMKFYVHGKQKGALAVWNGWWAAGNEPYSKSEYIQPQALYTRNVRHTSDLDRRKLWRLGYRTPFIFWIKDSYLHDDFGFVSLVRFNWT